MAPDTSTDAPTGPAQSPGAQSIGAQSPGAPVRTTSPVADRPPHVSWPEEPSGPGRWALTVTAVVTVLALVVAAGAVALTRLVSRPAPAAAGPAGAVPAGMAGAERFVVDVSSDMGWRGMGAAGTGLVISPTGEVVTNNHVIAGATAITVTVVGTGRAYPAAVVGYDVGADVAVLRVRGAGRMVAAVPATDAPRIGEPVTALGNAGGLGGTPRASAGRIVATGQSVTALDQISGTVEKLTNLIATTADVASGDSGGPLMDARGRVVGMNAAGAGDRRVPAGGVRGFAIPFMRVLAVAAGIESGRRGPGVHIGPTAFLGVEVTNSPGSGSPESGTHPGGALVYSVYPGTPAAAAGIAAGDRIVTLDGRPVSSAEAVRAVVERRMPGQAVDVAWWGPSGPRHTARITLTVGPPE